MWTKITRPKYEREGQRYASDLTDAEWALIEPYMPAVRRLGRPRETELRAVLDAILYIARTGCQWRMMPLGYQQKPQRLATSGLSGEALLMLGAATIQIPSTPSVSGITEASETGPRERTTIRPRSE